MIIINTMVSTLPRSYIHGCRGFATVPKAINPDKEKKAVVDNATMKEVSPLGPLAKEYPVKDIVKSLHGKNVIYMGHIKSTKHMHMFKFGISRAVQQRATTHKRNYDKFDLCFIAEYDRNFAVEKNFATLAKSRGILLDGFLSKNREGFYFQQKEVVAVSRSFPGITYADLALDMHNLIELDMAKYTGTYKGSVFIRERLNVD